MSLFSRGHWARYNVDPAVASAWIKKLDTLALFNLSAFVAKTFIASQDLAMTVGINPPSIPRADELEPFERAKLEREVHPTIWKQIQDKVKEPWIGTYTEPVTKATEPIDLVEDLRFGSDINQFKLSTNKYGFWFVLHERVDLDDKNSLKEQISADQFGQPFKSLVASSRKVVNDIVKDLDKLYLDRSQVPVIIDIEAGTCFLGTSSKKVMEAFALWMDRNGVSLTSTYMNMGSSHFHESLFDWIVENDLYKTEKDEALEKGPKTPTEDEEEAEEPEWSVATAHIEDFGEISIEAPVAFELSTGHAKVDTALDAYALTKIDPAHIIAATIRIKVEGAVIDLDLGGRGGITLVYRGLDPAINTKLLDKDAAEAKTMLEFWKRWAFILDKAEEILITGFATALDQDLATVGVVPAGPSEEETEVTVADAGSAVSALVNTLKKNGAGMSVSITTGGTETTEITL